MSNGIIYVEYSYHHQFLYIFVPTCTPPCPTKATSNFDISLFFIGKLQNTKKSFDVNLKLSVI